MNINSSAHAIVAIVDYGTGNLHSIKRCLDRCGVRSLITSRWEDVRSADKVILPGVGHFGRAARTLQSSGLAATLNEAVLGKRKPALGICLGMELMVGISEESDAAGLGWLKGRAIQLKVKDVIRYKVPHVGWNTILIRRPSILLDGIADDTEFYFAHGYHLELDDPTAVVTETDYERSFPSCIEHDNIFGVQFHPEKSHEAGARLLKNFIEL